jgi:hypothetical protein
MRGRREGVKSCVANDLPEDLIRSGQVSTPAPENETHQLILNCLNRLTAETLA